MRATPAFLAALLVARLLAAYVWLSGSLTNPPPAFGWVPAWIDRMAVHAPAGPVGWVVRGVVVPAEPVVLWTTFLLGLVLGTLFLVGAFMPWTGRVAAVWALLITLGSVWVPTDEPPYAHMMFVVLPWLVGEARAGRIAGVDAWRARRAERPPGAGA